MKTIVNLILIVIISSLVMNAKEKDIIQKEDLPSMLGITNIGRDYWFSVPPAFQLDYDLRDVVKVFVVSSQPAKVTLELPNRISTINALPYEVSEFILTPEEAQIYTRYGYVSEISNAIAMKQAVHVYSSVPILVYVMVNYRYVTEGFLALPVSALGNRYYVSSYGDGSGSHPGLRLPSLSGVVAPYDNSEVSFVLHGDSTNSSTGGLIAGDTLTKVLNSGDVWLFSSGGPDKDLSGSLIFSTKPVAVISGNQCASIPIGNDYCDYIAEMEFPAHSWGKNYPAISVRGRKYSSIVRIFTREPNTIIYRDHFELATLEEPGFYEARVTPDSVPGNAVFWSDNDIGVTVYNTGEEEDDDPKPKSDPFQMALVPEEQFQKELTFALPEIKSQESYYDQYIVIIYQCGFDGYPSDSLQIAKVTNGPLYWRKVAYQPQVEDVNKFAFDLSGHKYASLILPISEKGVYKLKNDSPFAVYVYGFSNYGSFGYPASANVNNIEITDTEAPVPTWTVNCNGTVEGFVTDMPEDENFRSNLATIFNFLDDNDNFDFSHGEFEPGRTRSTWWKLNVGDRSRDAVATLRFTDQAGNDSTVTIEYKAVKLDIEPDYIDFGFVSPNQKVKSNITVRNLSSTSEAIITRIGFKTDDQGFSIESDDLPFLLPPLGTKNIEISFMSDKDGVFVDSIGLGDTCIYYPKSKVKAEIGGPEIYVSDIQYGDILISDNQNGEVIISNAGKADLLITGYEGPFSSEFTAIMPNGLRNCSPSVPFIIKSGAPDVSFNVQFSPDNEVTYRDSIVFFSNAVRIDSIAYLDGKGLKPGLVATSCNFGRKRIHRDLFPAGPYDFPGEGGGIILENKGSAPVKLSGYSIIENDKGSAFKIDSSLLVNRTINVNDKFYLPVSFKPLEAGYHRLVIEYYNDGNSKTRTIIEGIGVVPIITVNDITFDATVIDDVYSISNKKLIIKNLGMDEWEFCDTLKLIDFENINIGDISFSTDFSLNKGFRLDTNLFDFNLLAPGTALQVNASFKAVVSDDVSTQLKILSDAESEIVSNWQGRGLVNGIEILADSSEICFGLKDTIICKIKNFGSSEVDVRSLSIDPPERDFYFADDMIPSGFSLASGESKEVELIFEPVGDVDKSVDLVAETSLPLKPRIMSEIKGKGIIIDKLSSITPATRKAEIGEKVKMSVYIDPGEDFSRAGIDRLDVMVEYDNSFIRIIPESIVPGEMADGLFMFESTPEINENGGSFTLSLVSIAGNYLDGSGNLIDFEFETYLPTDTNNVALITHSVVPVGTLCAEFESRSARIAMQPVCADEIRKLLFSAENYSLEEISPNPVGNMGTDINYSVGLEARTTIDIFCSNGQLAANIIDQNLRPGKYTASLPIDELRSGVYLVEMKSGPFSAVRKLVIAK